MYDRYAAIAMLLLACGLCLWARRERRLRRWAEEERDLYEDEIVTAHERDDALARAREERMRARARGATVTLTAHDEATPLLEKTLQAVEAMRCPSTITEKRIPCSLAHGHDGQHKGGGWVWWHGNGEACGDPDCTLHDLYEQEAVVEVPSQREGAE